MELINNYYDILKHEEGLEIISNIKNQIAAHQNSKNKLLKLEAQGYSGIRNDEKAL